MPMPHFKQIYSALLMFQQLLYTSRAMWGHGREGEVAGEKRNNGGKARLKTENFSTQLQS